MTRRAGAAVERRLEFARRPDTTSGTLRVPAGHDLVVAVDTLVEGVHFAPGTPPDDVGFRALAVNLSDLAAMGAKPASACVSLVSPPSAARWIDRFGDGLAAAAAPFGLRLDAAQALPGPLSVTVQVHGLVETGTALTRAGARAGDTIHVTGSLGDAGLALATRAGDARPAPDHRRFVERRLARPTPRIAAGRALRGHASAAIDVSDGLAQDLGHVLERSGVGARVSADRLPLSAALRATLSPEAAARMALGAGDDYELCFTLPRGAESTLDAVLGGLDCAHTRIGAVTAELGLTLSFTGAPFEFSGGYRHFT